MIRASEHIRRSGAPARPDEFEPPLLDSSPSGPGPASARPKGGWSLHDPGMPFRWRIYSEGWPGKIRVSDKRRPGCLLGDRRAAGQAGTPEVITRLAALHMDA